ncbi:MAG: AAA family ATPase, partial [Candidatus Methanomethylophilaceae archaeon]|nr:AAA family ATPase [Candidatus Methanomethylophilaceae archaeon]
MVRALPIGVQDFKEIRDSDYLYIDKTDMISQILSEGTEAYCFTRPRRFGKSLNLSMLDAFFNIKYPKDNKWFDGLKVSECMECQEHKNAYPVIYFDFKDLDANSYELFLKRLSIKLSNLFMQYEYLETSEKVNRVQRSRFDAIYSGTTDESELMNAIDLLATMLRIHHDKKVIILLDEYDNPIHNAYGKDFHKDIVDVMKGILSSVLKGDESLMFGVITG